MPRKTKNNPAKAGGRVSTLKKALSRKDRAKPTKPKQPSATSIEVDMRVHNVYQLILANTPTRKIIAFGMDRWGVTSRSVHRYINRATTLIQEEQKKGREVKFAVHIAKMETLLEKCMTASQYETARKVLSDMAVLQGFTENIGDTNNTLIQQHVVLQMPDSGRHLPATDA